MCIFVFCCFCAVLVSRKIINVKKKNRLKKASIMINREESTTFMKLRNLSNIYL